MEFGETGKFDAGLDSNYVGKKWREDEFALLDPKLTYGFRFDEKSISPIALARMLTEWLGEYSMCLHSVVEYGIWPSSQDLFLFNQFRKSLGEFRTIGQVSDQLFQLGESVKLASFMNISLQFGWGFYIIADYAGSKSRAIWISHDSWGRIEGALAADDIPGKLVEYNCVLI